MKEKILVYPIQYRSVNDVIKIKPIMDLHRGAKSCDLRAFKAYISDFDEFTYFYTNGDLWDSIYFRDKRFRSSGHENTDQDDAIDVEVQEMVELLTPIQDRLICVGHGNHEDAVLKMCSTNMSKRLADALGVPYVGYSFWFRLSLNMNGGKVRNVDIFSTHGFGGGTRTEGGSITKYAKFADRLSCDIFVVGHDHRKQYVRYPVMGIRGISDVRLIAQPKLVCLGGSWKKAYSSDTSTTWEETKGFSASEIGGIVIAIRAKEVGVDLSVSM